MSLTSSVHEFCEIRMIKLFLSSISMHVHRLCYTYPGEVLSETLNDDDWVNLLSVTFKKRERFSRWLFAGDLKCWPGDGFIKVYIYKTVWLSSYQGYWFLISPFVSGTIKRWQFN